MAAHATALQNLMDRAAIADLLARYFQGLDRGSREQVRECFTDDVVAHYDQRTPTKGIAALIDSLQNFNKLRDGTMKITTHFMGNLNFTQIEGDIAETEMNAIAFLVEPGKGPDEVSMRSLRYIDRMRRQENGWRISDRIHTLDWSCRVPANFSVTLAQRVSALPSRT
ncbi:MAG: nuclear transport factor 2 family protein [Pseudomonadota bacterium]